MIRIKTVSLKNRPGAKILVFENKKLMAKVSINLKPGMFLGPGTLKLKTEYTNPKK